MLVMIAHTHRRRSLHTNILHHAPPSPTLPSLSTCHQSWHAYGARGASFHFLSLLQVDFEVKIQTMGAFNKTAQGTAVLRPLMHMHGRVSSTPARRPRRRKFKAFPAESLRGQGSRVRRKASGRARLSRLAWPRGAAFPARAYHADANTCA